MNLEFLFCGEVGEKEVEHAQLNFLGLPFWDQRDWKLARYLPLFTSNGFTFYCCTQVECSWEEPKSNTQKMM
jgi:hypothetical protein